MVVCMNPLQVEIAKTVFAHIPAVGDLGIVDRGDLATMLHTACTEAALAGWASLAASGGERGERELT